MNRLSDNLSTDEDEILVFGRPLVAKQTGKRKLSQTQNTNKLQRSKPNNGTPPSSGKAKHVEQVKSLAMVQAERIQLSLGTESHCFIKCLVKSNVEGSFCVSLPLAFCSLHLPKGETMITLEDENGENFEVKYIPRKGLSAYWKKFAVGHKLRETDVLLFHLVEPKKFKVYIIRAHREVDVNPSLLNLDATSQQNEQCGPESSDATDPSQDLGTFEEFQLKMRGLCVESALDENTLKKYYKLCSCKDDILHDKIFCDHNSKLKAGVISEIVNIVDAVKACNIFTSREKLEQWQNSLKSFKLLGMNVEFLVNRVSQLLRLGVEFEGTRFEDEMKKLEVKRVELKEAYKKVSFDIEKMKSKAERHKVYIIRAHREVDVNPSLLNLDATSQQNEQCGPESSDPTDPSQHLGTFEEFQFKMRGLCVESALDENTLKKYYKLCRCKDDILQFFKIFGRLRRAPAVFEVIWAPPLPGWVKCNTDGSSKALGFGACGGLFRNCRGFVCGVFTGNLGRCDSFEAEFAALVMAVEHSVRLGWTNVWFEMDSMAVLTSFFNKAYSPPWRIRRRWENCLCHLEAMEYRCSHIFREGNVPADILSKLAFSFPSNRWWSSEISAIRASVFDNRVSKVMYRFRP